MPQGAEPIGGKFTTLGLFCAGAASGLFSGTDTYYTCFWYGFAFPSLRASTTIQGLLECLIHRQGIPYNLTSAHEIPSQRRNCGYGLWAMTMGSTGHLTYFIIQKEFISELENWRLTWTASLEEIFCNEKNTIIPDVLCTKSETFIWHYVPNRKNKQILGPSGGSRSGSTYPYLQWLTGETLLPTLTNLGFIG